MNITIIGAGKTGRGFLARLIQTSDHHITFIESDRYLVSRLKETGSISISYFAQEGRAASVDVSDIYHDSDPEGLQKAALCELIFVSVGAGNLGTAGRFLAQVLELRHTLLVRETLNIITAENAIDPAKKLEQRIMESTHGKYSFRVTESAIFCSTIENPLNPLDISSQEYQSLPYDASRIPQGFPALPFLIPVEDFSLLLKRKIFTYNCASAAIAYLGAYRGYVSYPDAANDPAVSRILDFLYEDVNTVLCAEYGIDQRDQQEFALQSKAKFQNRLILDSVERNAREAMRKLAPDERLIGPFLLMLKHEIRSHALVLVIASALRYASANRDPLWIEKTERGGLKGVLSDFCALQSGFDLEDELVVFYERLEEGESLTAIAADISVMYGGKA